MQRPPDPEMPTQSVDQTTPVFTQGDVLPRGARVGPYRIECLLGQGGMGEVYRAEQLEPVRRVVALKRMRATTLDFNQRAFFEVERQLLAQMRHPGIAQVFDAGTTEDGDPYFAMELIEGSPITQWCDDHRLGLEQRLRLFQRACAAVQHAHQKGVIHRDLKPSNILVAEVDSAPLPKIIDFGIATASGGHSAERAGTPDYMSPEQATLGADIDTRSDVYALGVVLCELLTSQRPSDSSAVTRTAPTTGGQPRSPSQRFAELTAQEADQRAFLLGISTRTLQLTLQRELDWVVLRAVAPDRNQRYPSAAALADDLQRFLDIQPLDAVPRHRGYVARKYLRRNRVIASAVGAVALAVLIGLGAALQGLSEARAQRALAEQRSAELERVAAFQRSLLERMDVGKMGQTLSQDLRGEALRSLAEQPIEGLDAERFEQLALRWNTTDLARNLVERHVLADAESVIARDFRGTPLVAADMQSALADLYLLIGKWQDAARLHRQVLQDRERLVGRADDKVLDTRAKLGFALARAGEADASLQALAPALELVNTRPADDPVRTRIELAHAQTLSELGRNEQAIAEMEAINGRLQQLDQTDQEFRELLLNNLGIALARHGERDRAARLLEALYELRLDRLGADHEDTLATLANLGNVLGSSGELERALALQQQIAQVRARLLGAEHPQTLADRNNVGATLVALGRLDEAEPELRAVLELRRAALGPFHPMTLRSALNLAALLSRREQHEEALVLQRDVVTRRNDMLGPEHPDSVHAALSEAATLLALDRLDEAARLATTTHAVQQRRLGAQHPDSLTTRQLLARIATARGDHKAARDQLEQALAGWEANLGRERAQTLIAAADLVAIERKHRPQRAEEVYARYLASFLDRPVDALDAGQLRTRERVMQALGDTDRDCLPGC